LAWQSHQAGGLQHIQQEILLWEEEQRYRKPRDEDGDTYVEGAVWRYSLIVGEFKSPGSLLELRMNC
jgi:hypothetical protein